MKTIVLIISFLISFCFVFSQEDSTKEKVSVEFELIMAAYNGDADYTLRLLKEKVDINTFSSDDLTPLQYAILGGHEKTVKVLVANGADINLHKSYKLPPLTLSIINDFHKITEYLLYKGADTENTDFQNNTPLSYAAAYDFIPAMNLLLSYGAKIEHKNYYGESPLWIASYYGNINMVYELLLAGADINSQNSSGVSPLMAKAVNNDTLLLNYLLVNKAKSELENNQHQTALDYTVLFNEKESFDILKLKSQLSKSQYKNLMRNAYLSNSFSLARSIGKQEKILFLKPVPYSFQFSYGIMFSQNDAIYNHQLIFSENRFRLNIRGGIDARYHWQRANYEYFEGMEFQFWEKRTLYHIGIDKQIRINKGRFHKNAWYYIGIRTNYTTTRFRGSDWNNEAYLSYSPYIGYEKSAQFFGWGFRYIWYETSSLSLNNNYFQIYYTFILKNYKPKKSEISCSFD